MSQFFGCVALKPRVDLGKIKTKITTAMSFFVPDSQGIFMDEHVFIVQKHLYNSIESHQAPTICETERYVLAASCRIDNREDLYHKLKLTGDIFGENSISDHEYILKTYETFQEDCVKHLIGDFSFVVWDKQKQTLFMAKDHLGVRPLFYLKNDGFLLFSTSITGIKAAFDKHLTINQLYLAYNLKNCPPPVGLTFFEDIHRLQPAHFCIFSVENGLLTERRYWELEPVDISEFKTHEERLAEIRRLFEQAVKCRTRTTKNIGCQLSGGIDSSAITVQTSRLIDKNRLHTYSFVLNEKTRAYSELGIDEQSTQNEIIDYATLKSENHHKIEEFHFKDVYEEMECSNIIMGGYANHDAIWQATLFKEAQKNSVGISFSGFLGDECVSNDGGAHYFDYINNLDWINLWKFFMEYKFKSVKRILMYFLSQMTGTTNISYQKLHRSRSLLNPKSKLNKKVKFKPFSFYPSFKQYLIKNITKEHTCLRTESEGAYALQYGIETVYPLGDIRLLQLTISLPIDMFKPMPMPRMLFRNLCLGILPDSVRMQTKFNGAMTLAFAEFVKQKQYREFDGYLITDKLDMITPLEKVNSTELGNLRLVLNCYKLDYLVFINSPEL